MTWSLGPGKVPLKKKNRRHDFIFISTKVQNKLNKFHLARRDFRYVGTQHKSLTKISLYIHIGNYIQSTAWTEVTDKKI